MRYLSLLIFQYVNKNVSFKKFETSEYKWNRCFENLNFSWGFCFLLSLLIYKFYNVDYGKKHGSEMWKIIDLISPHYIAEWFIIFNRQVKIYVWGTWTNIKPMFKIFNRYFENLNFSRDFCFLFTQ